MIDPALIQDHITEYFAAEKRGGLVLAMIGVVAIGAAIYLLVKSHRLRAMSYPLIAIALIQIGVGFTVYRRCDAQAEALAAQVIDSPDQFEADEAERMAKVERTFTFLIALEVALLAAGVGLARWKRRDERWFAVALGVIVQTSLCLAFDVVAERRAAGYVTMVEALKQSGKDMMPVP